MTPTAQSEPQAGSDATFITIRVCKGGWSNIQAKGGSQIIKMFKVTSTTIYTQYKAQTKCKTRFHSQGMILNGF